MKQVLLLIWVDYMLRILFEGVKFSVSMGKNLL